MRKSVHGGGWGVPYETKSQGWPILTYLLNKLHNILRQIRNPNHDLFLNINTYFLCIHLTCRSHDYDIAGHMMKVFIYATNLMQCGLRYVTHEKLKMCDMIGEMILKVACYWYAVPWEHVDMSAVKQKKISEVCVVLQESGTKVNLHQWWVNLYDILSYVAADFWY